MEVIIGIFLGLALCLLLQPLIDKIAGQTNKEKRELINRRDEPGYWGEDL
mgnify:CR=1 FL=1